ncbi:MAG: hypothetical protein N7Q72_04410 [Spiroplasma sp. Tabriz.8]|nr:hypothetical protein [Spiroplasma sp. Tabriz.8]
MKMVLCGAFWGYCENSITYNEPCYLFIYLFIYLLINSLVI